MNPRKIWPIVVLLLMIGGATTAQDKEDNAHNRVRVRLDLLTLRDGLPMGAGGSSLFSVGGVLGKHVRTVEDGSGKVVYVRSIEGQSRWLPDNPIEVTLEITENDAKRTETILLEGFEPKTLVLHGDSAHGTRDLLRLIPVSGQLEPDKSLSVPVEGLGKMESNPEPGKFQLVSPVFSFKTIKY